MSIMYFDGVDTSISDYNLLIGSIGIDIASPTKVDYQPIPYSYGGVSLGAYSEERILNVSGFLCAENETEFYSRLDNLNRLFQKNGEVSIRFSALYPDRWWKGRVYGSISGKYRERRMTALQFSILCSDSRAYGLVEQEEEYVVASSPLQFYVPDDPGEVVGGSTVTPPVFLLDGDGSGFSNVKLENFENDMVLQWNGTLLANHVLRIDCLRMIVERSTDGGANWSPSMSLIGSDHRFPVLVPALRNQLYIHGVSSGNLKVSYWERYR